MPDRDARVQELLAEVAKLRHQVTVANAVADSMQNWADVAERCEATSNRYADENRRLRAEVEAADTKWIDWLAATAYGIDWRCAVDPPVDLDAYAARWEAIDPRQEEIAWTIEQETGPWGRTKETT